MSTNEFYRTLNQTTHPFPSDKTLHGLITDQCERVPDQIAVVSGEQSQTYRSLHEISNRIANLLIDAGVQRGNLVGLCCNRNIDTPSLLVGILKSGAGYVPLDPEYPLDRLRFMIEDSGVKHILCHQEQHDMLASMVAHDVKLIMVAPDASASTSRENSRPVLEPATDVAYVIYTSGSTGTPKGVAIPHRGVVNLLTSLQRNIGFTESDCLIATGTLSFDISVMEMYLPLISGGVVAVVDRETARDAARLVAAIDRYAATTLLATPAMWRMILTPQFTGGQHMKFLSGGEALPRDLADQMLKKSGAVWNLYGPTEASVCSHMMRVGETEDKILIGPPLANTTNFIVDKEEQLCPPGTPGELLIGGVGLGVGYINRRELNAEKFAHYQGQRIYRTGDLVQATEDGKIEHLGRIDSQIKLNGHRIELGEIDAALLSQSGVRMASTVLREDRPGDKRLVGYLVALSNAKVDSFTIRTNLAESLPLYMVPSAIVVLDAFPQTPSGKLDSKAFPKPQASRGDLPTEYVAPSTQTEQQFAAIWADVLEIDQIGVNDNFFDLGGNSMRAAAVVKRANAELKLGMTSATFFDKPTIRQLLRKPEARASQLRASNVDDGDQFAIVGIAAKMPGAKNVEEFWNNLVAGRESIQFFSKEELDPSLDAETVADPNYVRARGVIEGATEFDARFFSITPKSAELIDPQQRILLELAWTALEDAGCLASQKRHTVGVWAGAYSNTYHTKNLLSNPELIREVGDFQIGAHNEKDFIATRIAHKLNLRGPAINVNTACSTSLVALIEACKSLTLGHCNVALAGGAAVTFPQKSGHLHQTGSIFTPDGHCRPFDAEGRGTLFSDGAALVVVKRLADAKADGDRIYCVIRGFGINNDGGEKASFSAPSIEGQMNAIAMAHQSADVLPESITYIEAHGTATPVGDPIEVTALQNVFAAQTDKRQFCAIGSVKSNIGHTVATAGVAGLIKTALSLHHQQIPATLHFEKPNPEIDFDNSPFYVCDKLTSWERSDAPRRAGVSAFGVGGTNAHVILEEAPPVERPHQNESLPLQLIPLSARTNTSLVSSAGMLSANLHAQPGVPLSDVAMTLQQRRESFAHRGFVVAEDTEEASADLHKQKAPGFCSGKASATPRDIVFMFPGQGSQYVRMGQDLYEHSSVFRESLDECCEKLIPHLGRDLRDVLFPPTGDEKASQEILKATCYTQPALFSIGYSLAQMWRHFGIQPATMIGHSIGEFSAACIAGVFSLDDGLKMIAARGELMQALPGGSMMSVRLPGAEVEPMLFGDLAIGSFNGPALCVVAGPTNQCEQLQEQLESLEVVCRMLHTSHAFHSPMMDEIVRPFTDVVSKTKLSPPLIPIVSTVTGQPMTAKSATDPDYWASHLRLPVRFSDAVQQVWSEDPTRMLIELGPRRTLATLAKQHADDPKTQIALPTLSDNSSNHAEWRATLTALGQLWVAGAKPDWTAICNRDAQHVTLPTYQFDHKNFFIAPGSPAAIVSTTSNVPSLSTSDAPSLSQEPAMSRKPNLIQAINEVFESTSGFDLTEFETDTTFFEMGLDSLVLTQTATSLKKAFDLEVTFRQLLEETPNVDSLADFLDSELPADKYPAPAAESTSSPVVETVAAAPAPATESASVVQQDTITPAPALAPSVPSATVASLPLPVAIPVGNDVQAIIQSQLQVMAAQLSVLGGVAPQATAPAQVGPTTTEAPTTVAAEQSQPTPEPPKAITIESSGAAKRSFGAAARVALTDSSLSVDQQAALENLVQLQVAKMPKSKAYAQKHRHYLADPRTVSGFRPTMKEMTFPLVVERSKGVHMWDLDGNQYIDVTCGFGSNFLGHSHEIIVEAVSKQVAQDLSIGPQSPLAGEVAKIFCEMTGCERMAFANTGSEAVLGASRLARTYSGREKIAMFTNDYHGILDEVIVRGNKKQKSFPAATGIPSAHVSNTLILEYGTEESLQILRDNMDDLAAIIVEPVQSRKPELQPREFLQELRRMTENEKTALIFDEVITGFRIAPGGAQQHFGVQADLATYGKVVGGGMPIGVIGGKAQYMDGLDGGYWEFGDDSRPEAGMTYFAGTFVRHPVTLAASKAILKHLQSGGQEMYDRANGVADYMANELNAMFAEMKAPIRLSHFGTLFKVEFTEELAFSELLFAGMRRRGIHIWEHRPCLLTLAHRKEHIDTFVSAFRESIVELQQHGFIPGNGPVSASAPASQPAERSTTTETPKQGNDRNGNPGWFVTDSQNPGQFIQVNAPL
ncbi:MAG: amino acid adenylation domain-containing protein [Rubripirellula sp.]